MTKTAPLKFFLILIFTISSLSFANPKNTYQYECVLVGDDAYVTIKIWNPQKGKNYKLEQARKDAIHTVLYSGIPPMNGCIYQKPLLNKQEEQKNFSAFEKDFFNKNGEWETFSRVSETATTFPEYLGQKDWKVYKVSVAKNQLRQFLEAKNIIKPLNTGF